MSYTYIDILEELDQAAELGISKFYPKGLPGDIKYNFFLDLEHGYCKIAGSKIHLYADDASWAIVFETSGYHNRSLTGVIDLIYVGNCINYIVDKHPERNYITNMKSVTLIEFEEWKRIEAPEAFECIRKDVREVKVRDAQVPFKQVSKTYEQLGINIEEYDNPERLIDFSAFMRYLHAIFPTIISASEEDIKACIPPRLPKIMTIDAFHHGSSYEKPVLPSKQETYQLIARVLESRDISLWKPTLAANNHWKNWDSGFL